MWRYALYLTGNNGASILAGIVFAFVPYRFDHMHHLELQATIFLPLTLLYFERTLETGSRRDAALMMAAYVAEVFSCIYYSIFLATALVPIGAIRLWKMPAEARRRIIRRHDPGGRLRPDRGGAIRICVRAQPCDARRAARERHPLVFGDPRQLPRDHARKRRPRRVERAVRPVRALPVSWRAGDRAGGAWTLCRSIAGA